MSRSDYLTRLTIPIIFTCNVDIMSMYVGVCVWVPYLSMELYGGMYVTCYGSLIRSFWCPLMIFKYFTFLIFYVYVGSLMKQLLLKKGPHLDVDPLHQLHNTVYILYTL